MNQVILTGRLTKDPELRKTETGKSIARFTLAVDKYGEGADFLNCITWDKNAENLTKYQGKGSQIALNGRIQSRTFTDTKGNTQYITEIIADTIEYLGTKKEPTTSEQNPFKEFGNNIKTETNGVEIQDNDLPF